jgi:hypothetical protein
MMIKIKSVGQATHLIIVQSTGPKFLMTPLNLDACLVCLVPVLE